MGGPSRSWRWRGAGGSEGAPSLAVPATKARLVGAALAAVAVGEGLEVGAVLGVAVNEVAADRVVADGAVGGLAPVARGKAVGLGDLAGAGAAHLLHFGGGGEALLGPLGPVLGGALGLRHA